MRLLSPRAHALMFGAHNFLVYLPPDVEPVAPVLGRGFLARAAALEAKYRDRAASSLPRASRGHRCQNLAESGLPLAELGRRRYVEEHARGEAPAFYADDFLSEETLELVYDWCPDPRQNDRRVAAAPSGAGRGPRRGRSESDQPRISQFAFDAGLDATVWFDTKPGYLGAYFDDAFTPPALLRVIQALRTALPRIVGDKELKTAWAYKRAARAGRRRSRRVAATPRPRRS